MFAADHSFLRYLGVGEDIVGGVILSQTYLHLGVKILGSADIVSHLHLLNLQFLSDDCEFFMMK